MASVTYGKYIMANVIMAKVLEHYSLNISVFFCIFTTRNNLKLWFMVYGLWNGLCIMSVYGKHSAIHKALILMYSLYMYFSYGMA